ncbi:2-alkenal reductase [Pseudorhizobium halotolerans]|uniref:2-alkenal reductase n=1 Tax=Pseudorhizobium halotolerans TaxID=1233081 RepID=A0ABM8PY03_9HYPH|nr:trypsin-like peptidase domain-containing protein [Pseudorhizobium halotolerans]MCA0344219.1 trypsin-like peptidase domain-containing protein [Pseudomonadota bacterium]CAD7054424.1 2-alkenal reductase [Pseudorhizobium halotolerans]
MRRAVWVGSGLLLTAALTFFIGSLWRQGSTSTSAGRLVAVDNQAHLSPEQSRIQVFASASQKVVFITTSRRDRDPWSLNPLNVPNGTGSGFVWDEEGHIVTNYHVIEEATDAIVTLSDGQGFKARLVGAAPELDLAVLKVSAGRKFPSPIPVGRSDDLKVGQDVLAIGNPFGLDRTLTTGIVSALNRELPTKDGQTLKGLIQTDAAINPGNSGGPLLDSQGRLVGVNTAIYSPSGASAGIGFAVPVAIVSSVVPSIIAGTPRNLDFGIHSDDSVSQAILQQLDLEGVLVLEVTPGSSAERIGIRPTRRSETGSLILGDVIVAVGNRAVRSYEEMQTALGNLATADTTLLVVREGRRQQITVSKGLSRSPPR